MNGRFSRDTARKPGLRVASRAGSGEKAVIIFSKRSACHALPLRLISLQRRPHLRGRGKSSLPKFGVKFCHNAEND